MNRAAVYGIIAVIVIAAIGGYAYYYYSHGTVDVYVTTGNADPIYLTISSIMIHSTSGSWITISNKTETVLLTSNLSFLASASVPPGNYTEIRLVISSATVEIAGVNVSVSVPSGVVKVPIVAGGLHVSAGSTAKLAIIIGPHLVRTGSGQYILSPVITARQIS